MDTSNQMYINYKHSCAFFVHNSRQGFYEKSQPENSAGIFMKYPFEKPTHWDFPDYPF